jgi:hypothetical protein
MLHLYYNTNILMQSKEKITFQSMNRMKHINKLWEQNTEYFNIVTYAEFSWLIIMISGLGDWFYSHFYTTKVNYDSSQSMTLYDSSHSMLDHEHLPFHCDEWWPKNSCSQIELPRTTSVWRSLLRMNYDPFITSRWPEYRSPSHMVPLLFSRSHENIFVNTCCH